MISALLARHARVRHAALPRPPAMREWFYRLKVSQKLMLISVFFIMPDSLMLYLFITGINFPL